MFCFFHRFLAGRIITRQDSMDQRKEGWFGFLVRLCWCFRICLFQCVLPCFADRASFAYSSRWVVHRLLHLSTNVSFLHAPCLSYFITFMSLINPVGCGSKNRYQNGTLVIGNVEQNLRNPSWLILSYTQFTDKHLCGVLPVKRLS